MKKFLTLAVWLGVFFAGRLAAQSLVVDWFTVGGGGGMSSDGTLVIAGTAGQSDAGVMSDGALTVRGGFWQEDSFGSPAAPQITSQPASQFVPLGGSVALTVVVSGTGPFTYQWTLNGGDVPNIITTIAGNGGTGYTGDGGPATYATLGDYQFAENKVAVDAVGNVYFTDPANSAVRKVDANGIITTIAGAGYFNSGFTGDGGPATNAHLSLPKGVTVDAAGNIFIADTYNNCIRKIDTSGIISTVAGVGTFGNAGFSGDGGLATNAHLTQPSSVAVDTAGNLFIADDGNYRVRKVDTNGIITTYAGNGNAAYNGGSGFGYGVAATNAGLYVIQDLALDAAGNLFIADFAHNLIRKVDTNGIINDAVQVGSPTAVAVDAAGNLLFAEQFHHSVFKLAPSVPLPAIYENLPRIAGRDNPTPAFTGDGGPASDAFLHRPTGLAVDAAGSIYIADHNNNRIRKVSVINSTGPTLTLGNFNTNLIGNYQVVITSSYGSITSNIASVTGGIVPHLSITTAGTGQATISWMPDTSGFYLQQTDSLELPNWSAAPSGTNQPIIVPVSIPFRFYRLHAP